MEQAVLWGLVGAAPLFVGAVLALVRPWPERLIGIVLGFGAGALMASIAFELWEEGLEIAGPWPVVAGVALGALGYYAADRMLERTAPATAGSAAAGVAASTTTAPAAAASTTTAGAPLALGALLDGIPEQLVLGIGLAAGEGVSVALVVAIIVSNLPESVGSASDLLVGGMRRSRVLALWAGVALVCAVATVAGYAIADAVGAEFRAAVGGFAAGALLVMLVDSMVPEAQSKAKQATGLATVLGFAVAAWLALAA